MVSVGVREALAWNVSDILRRLERKHLVSKHGAEWEIRKKGADITSNLIGESVSLPQQTALRAHLRVISDPAVRSFVEEAVLCCEAKAFRAAVILSWIASLSTLQRAAIHSKGAEVSAAAVARLSTAKKRHPGIRDLHDFEKIKEADQLHLFEDIGLIGSTLKKQLIERLNLRNACGHPSGISVTEIAVTAHVDFLIQNVLHKT